MVGVASDCVWFVGAVGETVVDGGAAGVGWAGCLEEVACGYCVS